MLVDRAIFLESTLSQEEINPYLKKSDLLLPSITRGQLVKLYASHPEVKEVVIVDGVFEQSPSITHKEILWLLSKGVKIVGMGSMGALRAYELRNNGMQGYGWVYDQFLNECIDGDDEVAVAYDPLNPAKSKTLALINFRKVIEKHGEFANYLPIIRRIHYRERTWSALTRYLPGKIIESLSRLVFNGLKIHRSHILGHHLSPVKRGMMAVMKTFNRMRPGVAAFALGQAQATLDYVKINLILTQQQMIQMQLLDAEVMASRLMVYQAAVRVNQDSEESAYASVAKAKATEVAEKVIKFAIQLYFFLLLVILVLPQNSTSFF